MVLSKDGDTPNAQMFLAANEASPVIAGEAIGEGGQGAHYDLQNGKRFTLSAAECSFVGHPRWKFG